MSSGKLPSALCQLSSGGCKGVLSLDTTVGTDTTRDILVSKHLAGEPADAESLLTGEPPVQPDSVMFSSLTRDVIRRAALHTHSTAGPSGVDADGWRCMCTAFFKASDELCDSLATCACRIATTYVNPATLEVLVACRLIALDKPGVRPIGIGDVARCIAGKAILTVTGRDIQDAAGTLQLCAGQECGIEAAIHAMHDVYREEDADAILLADASNAFNRLSREACLRNIHHLPL